METKLVIELLEQALQELRRPDDIGVLPPPRRKRQRIFSPEFWAIVDACKMNREEVEHSPSRIAKSLAAVCKMTPDVTVEEIALRVRRYRIEFNGCSVTPEALSKHWTALGIGAMIHETPLKEV